MAALPDFLKKINFPEIQLDEAKKKALLIYGGAALVILIAYFFFFLKPGLGKLFELLPKVRERKIAIKSVRNDLLLEDKLKVRLRVLKKGSSEYEKKLPREKELPIILENLSKIARSSRVKILSITPQAEKVGGEGVYQEVPVLISARSGYHELGAFIDRLENNARYMQVSDIKIRSAGDNPKRHNVEFIVHAYTVKENRQ